MDVPPEDLGQEINKLKEISKPTAAEGLIRDLHERISRISLESKKDYLKSKLKFEAHHGLKKNLLNLIESEGLEMEALELVLKFLTTKEELAKYLYNHPEGEGESSSMKAVRKRLGPSLETLGGLCTKNIDVKKPWVKRLVAKAPSHQELARLSVSELEVGFYS